MQKNNFYVYVLLDPRKPGIFIYEDLIFDFEPFYVGKGILNRINISKYDNSNKHKVNKVRKIEDLGLNIISYKIYDKISEKIAFDYEITTIKKIGKIILNEGPLVNVSDGGAGGDNISKHPDNKKIRLKMSIAQSGIKNSFYGKKHKKETVDAMRKKLSFLFSGEKNPFYGKKHTEETKLKQKNAKKNKYDGEKNPFYGKKHTEETKNKLREINKGKKLSDSHKLKISNGLKNKNWSGKNNPTSTKYIISNPNNEILEFIGREQLISFFKGVVNYQRILSEKKYKGYTLIEKIKINKKP